jgi:hypothetical protein
MREALGYRRRKKLLKTPCGAHISAPGHETLQFRPERGSQRIQAELAIQIAPSSRVKLVKTGDGAHDPLGINQLRQRIELFGQWNVSQGWLLHARCELQEIAKQAIEDADLILEGRLTVFGEGGCIGEKLREALAVCGALKDAQGVPPSFLSFFYIHLDG